MASPRSGQPGAIRGGWGERRGLIVPGNDATPEPPDRPVNAGVESGNLWMRSPDGAGSCSERAPSPVKS
jgi:hypothetical protein